MPKTTKATGGAGAGSAAKKTAEKPAKAGGERLSIERVFTTEGVHPYDEVEWERRDVVMTNWRDGSVNFEQRGVEFPEFWSQNATQIVTSKYFRGAVGTPQRESSLKQLIDRVVHTYRKAGEEHDYFASSQDAQIFAEELTWLLLHQYFSFNSPVWFNVGTEAAQQVSACFILSVDDTMESILDWYKEEGMIFKGGSGAGVNLSKIRASAELLSSGGNASGPISFMRGADASAGTIKSGGATRRAAKMVVLDVDHPDIEEFIDTKAREEDKIRALRDAGFDVDLGGEDMFSVQYQNANNSVRVSDTFMRAVEEGTDYALTARMDGKEISRRDAREVFRKMAEAAWECADPGIQYDDTINDWHTNTNTDRIYASNPCSEYLSLNDSSCNLASLNLMKFLGEEGSFDVERFVKCVEFVITAMEISISFADFPTEKIGQTTRDYRQLGIGYSNLGALLMASGHAYDSEEGRALAASITALMTGVSYRRSAEIAGAVGPYAGYELNAEPHQRVMRKHAEAADRVETFGDVDATILEAARSEWASGNAIGAQNGWRNAQASVLAPTGCLIGDTLITTDRGLTRLESLGDPFGAKWQDLDATVSTDDGPKQTTKFFVNGEEPTRRISTESGYRIQGTLAHRIKVVEEATGQWEWKRLADINSGDLVPIQMRTLVGEPNRVPLPVLDQAYYTEDGQLTVPDEVREELAELVGYFMGDGSLHAKGIRLCVAQEDQDVVDHLCSLSEKLFNLTPRVTAQQGYSEVTLQSVRLARWWQAAGFAKGRPSEEHSGKGWKPRVPAAILETNAESVYESFLRGLFEADGTVGEGVQSVCTCTPEFADEIRTLLLVLGFSTTTRTTATGWGGDASVVRLRNIDHALNFAERIGFIGNRKNELQAWEEPARSAKRDRVFLPREVWEELVPVDHQYRGRVIQSLRKHGGVARQVVQDLYAHTRDERLLHALGYLFERVEANEDGGIVPTYDLSVPENVTYVANGMVSHNTISFMMDCDTTGIEPDLALVKHKKLVGGGSMEIVNQTVPRALARLGYIESDGKAIVDYIAEHGHVIGAPALAEEHYSVFDCAMGERSISPMGHVHMMAAVQPFLSGSVSKTVNLPEQATVEDIEQVYFEGWKLGLKALAVYRDNCKVGQPLSAKKKEIDKAVEEAVEKVVEEAAHAPVRRKLPKRRPSQTTSFSVGGAEGYITSSSYPDDGLGEVFLKMSKQGSTLAGVMDALSVAISIALQYGVPLEKYVEKFTNMRFEPAGMTDDPDIRMASSVVDYVFRRLALDYLPFEERAALGIMTTAERTAEVNGEDPSKVRASDEDDVDFDALRSSAPIEEAVRERAEAESTGSRLDLLHSAQTRSDDAPLCMNCGTKMRPAGSCYACEGCGATSGCS
ncbi:vitamin B12-dependent ribonucleotide reductase [Glycomyces salinus]|uniref:vitamin B12-dependent ribonucleotide reductase n=1 Tax=Glycomyces salinus TaxID=980294 RepID=UPI001E34E83F|nr:vitamin B12-dependent ribonucleotide reductase [Glycomyces salinus]